MAEKKPPSSQDSTDQVQQNVPHVPRETLNAGPGVAPRPHSYTLWPSIVSVIIAIASATFTGLQYKAVLDGRQNAAKQAAELEQMRKDIARYADATASTAVATASIADSNNANVKLSSSEAQRRERLEAPYL